MKKVIIIGNFPFLLLDSEKTLIEFLITEYNESSFFITLKPDFINSVGLLEKAPPDINLSLFFKLSDNLKTLL